MLVKVTSLENGSSGFRLDRSRIMIGSLADEPDDLAHWLQQPPDVRLAGIEFLRRQFYSYGEARREFRRLLEITQSPRG
jgi:hypothetical protein